MNWKKGQGAMEYLMTYGWAVLVVMLVGIVLWQLGMFEGKDRPVKAMGFTKLIPQPVATGLTKNGVFTGVFTSAIGRKVQVKGVQITDLLEDSILCCSHTGLNSDCLAASSNAASDIQGEDYAHFNGGGKVGLPAGDNLKVVLGGSGASSNCQITGSEVGDDIELNIAITYEITLTGQPLTYTTSGKITGSVEE